MSSGRQLAPHNSEISELSAETLGAEPASEAESSGPAQGKGQGQPGQGKGQGQPAKGKGQGKPASSSQSSPSMTAIWQVTDSQPWVHPLYLYGQPVNQGQGKGRPREEPDQEPDPKRSKAEQPILDEDSD